MIRAVGSLVSSVTPQPRAPRPPALPRRVEPPHEESRDRAQPPEVRPQDDAPPATAIPPVRASTASTADARPDARATTDALAPTAQPTTTARAETNGTAPAETIYEEPAAPPASNGREPADVPRDDIEASAPGATPARAPSRRSGALGGAFEDDDMRDVELLLEDARQRAHSAIDDSVRQAQTLLRSRQPRERSLGHQLDQRLERLDTSVASLSTDVRAVQQRLDRIEALLRETLEGRAEAPSAPSAPRPSLHAPAELDYPSITSVLRPKTAGPRHRIAEPEPRSALPPVRRPAEPQVAPDVPEAPVEEPEAPAALDVTEHAASQALAVAALETPVEPAPVAPLPGLEVGDEPAAATATADVAEAPTSEAEAPEAPADQAEIEPVAEALAELAEARAGAAAEAHAAVVERVAESAAEETTADFGLPREASDIVRPTAEPAPTAEAEPEPDIEAVLEAPAGEAPDSPSMQHPVEVPVEEEVAHPVAEPMAEEPRLEGPAAEPAERIAEYTPPAFAPAFEAARDDSDLPVAGAPEAAEAPEAPEAPAADIEAEVAEAEASEALVVAEVIDVTEGIEVTEVTEFTETDVEEPTAAAELELPAVESVPEEPVAAPSPVYEAPAALPAVPASAVPPVAAAPERVRFAAEAGSVVLRISPISGFQGLMRVQDALARVSAVREASVEAYSQGEARLRIRLGQEAAAGQLASALSERLNQPVRLRDVSSAERTLSVALG